MLTALLTCPHSHSAPAPARTCLVSRSSYVPGQPQRSRPGTYLACFSLVLRAHMATVLQSRHVTGMFLARLTCPERHRAPVPARTWHAYRSSYVPAQPQPFHPGTYFAIVPLFLRTEKEAPFPAAPPSNQKTSGAEAPPADIALSSSSAIFRDHLPGTLDRI